MQLQAVMSRDIDAHEPGVWRASLSKLRWLTQVARLNYLAAVKVAGRDEGGKRPDEQGRSPPRRTINGPQVPAAIAVGLLWTVMTHARMRSTTSKPGDWLQEPSMLLHRSVDGRQGG